MKKLILSVFALAAVVLSANAVDNQATTTGSGEATLVKTGTVEVLTSGQINSGVLQFGKISLATNTAKTVTITPPVAATVNSAVGTPATTGDGITLLNDIDKSTGAFKVNGPANTAYSVAVATSTLSGVGLSAGVTIDSWTTSFASNALTGGVLSASGTQNFFLGGTLHIPADVLVGAYSGNINVTVTYN